MATDLSRESKSREKVASEVGERFVRDRRAAAQADRLHAAAARREVFLCHAFCEVGATPARCAALTQACTASSSPTPSEVLILSIEDDTTAAGDGRR